MEGGRVASRSRALLQRTSLLLASSALALQPVTIPNFRDVGGLSAANGRVVRSGLLHRSGSPANASRAEADAVLQTLSVRTVLDLRGEDDAGKDSGPRHLLPATKYLPLLTSDMMRSALIQRARARSIRSFMKLLAFGAAKKLSPSRRLREYLGGEVDIRLARLLDTVSLADLYGLIIAQRQQELKSAAEMCASGEALPLLVHCTHGKDRTGVLVALLLYSCGVPEEEIVKDYTRSHEWGCSVEGKWAMRQALPERVRDHVDQTVLDGWCEAPDGILHELFDSLRRDYGSVEAYLDEIGVDEALRAQLTERLTVPAS